MEISTKLVHQYIAILFNFSPTSSHLHSLQVENCDSNSRLVVDEDDIGKFMLGRVKFETLVFGGLIKHLSAVRVNVLSDLTRNFEPMLAQCWSTVRNTVQH